MVKYTTMNKVSVSSKEELNETVNKIIPRVPRHLPRKTTNNYMKASKLKVNIKDSKNKYE